MNTEHIVFLCAKNYSIFLLVDLWCPWLNSHFIFVRDEHWTLIVRCLLSLNLFLFGASFLEISMSIVRRKAYKTLIRTCPWSMDGSIQITSQFMISHLRTMDRCHGMATFIPTFGWILLNNNNGSKTSQTEKVLQKIIEEILRTMQLRMSHHDDAPERRHNFEIPLNE